MNVDKAVETYNIVFQLEPVEETEQRFEEIDHQLYDYMNDNGISDESEALESMSFYDIISAGEYDACMSSI